ncbi:chorismate-binding protein [Brachybacterium sp. EF45031]|uniref:isochorismate synthase n=1 Tax=Brachybacterium sillae TaxID=2810536 RepID=UPI00217D02F8|nr:chorismate-binding protein [Brachybacterium sillae]MCS6711278.1 chorismate-binding protein [Brachybacterium sillae]
MPAPASAPSSPPMLHVRTVRLEAPVALRERIPADPSGVWLHQGEGLLAVGAAAELTATGPQRAGRLAEDFRALAARARVEDAMRVRGSGLVALGSLSYAATSPRPSRLVVPRALLGVRDGEGFLTVISTDGPVTQMPPVDRVFPVRAVAADAERLIDLEPHLTPDEYQSVIAEAIERIRAGAVQKVVLSATMSARSRCPIVLGDVLARLADRFPSTWVYRVGDVLGASPEMLAATEAGALRSRVLAGSRPVEDDAPLAEADRRAFRHDAKERAEHAFAVASVVESLERIAVEVQAPAEPFVLRLPGIEHLASDVTARLPQHVSSLEAAGVLHPSAAVCGTPRAAAEEVISALEGLDRGGYAAPVGWMDARGDGQWAIALRMGHVVDAHTLRLQAGGGVVAASDPVSEHAEALAKMRPVLRALRD